MTNIYTLYTVQGMFGQHDMMQVISSDEEQKFCFEMKLYILITISQMWNKLLESEPRGGIHDEEFMLSMIK